MIHFYHKDSQQLTLIKTLMYFFSRGAKRGAWRQKYDNTGAGSKRGNASGRVGAGDPQAGRILPALK